MGAVPIVSEYLKSKRILMVLAHPDDEVVFGWPILSGCGYVKGVLILSWNNCQRASEGPLREVCSANGAELVGLPLCQNNFYRLEPRFVEHPLMETVKTLQADIKSAVEWFRPDFIFTHNPMGEYGHGDHRLLFELCGDFPLLLTDICQENKSHPSTEKVPRVYRETLYRPERCVGRVVLDLAWYEKMKGVYQQTGAWTWSGHEPVTECGLYAV